MPILPSSLNTGYCGKWERREDNINACVIHLKQGPSFHWEDCNYKDCTTSKVGTWIKYWTPVSGFTIQGDFMDWTHKKGLSIRYIVMEETRFAIKWEKNFPDPCWQSKSSLDQQGVLILVHLYIVFHKKDFALYIKGVFHLLKWMHISGICHHSMIDVGLTSGTLTDR